MEFRKKPVVIEAFQMTEYQRADNSAWPSWLHEAWQIGAEAAGGLYPGRTGTSEFLRIKTLEGVMHVSPDDWIIKGVQGEIYPCKPDIFAATYEVADAHQPCGKIDGGC